MWQLLISTTLLSAALPIDGTFLPGEKHNHPIDLNETSTTEDHSERDGRSFLASLGHGNERPDRSGIVVLLSSEEQLQRAHLPQSDEGPFTSIPIKGWLVPSPSNPDVFNLVLDSNVESRMSAERKPQPQLLWRFDGDRSPASQYAEKSQTPMLRLVNPSAQYEIVPAPAAPAYILTPTAQNNKRPIGPQASPVPVASPTQPSGPYQPPTLTYSPPVPSPSYQPSSPPAYNSPSPPPSPPPMQSFSPQPQKPSSTFGANNPYLQQAFAQQQRPPNQPVQMAQPPYVPPVPSSPTQPAPVATPPIQPPYVASYPISSPPPPPPPQNVPEPQQSAPPTAEQGPNQSAIPSPQGNATSINANSTAEDITKPLEAGHVTSTLNNHQSNHQTLSQVPPPPPSTPQQPTAVSSTYIATISYGPDRPSLVFNCTKTDQLNPAELSSGSFVEGPYGYSCRSSQGSPLASAGGQIVGMNNDLKDYQPAPLQITVPIGITATDLARPEKIRLRPQSNLISNFRI